jgi:hypothetical protein
VEEEVVDLKQDKDGKYEMARVIKVRKRSLLPPSYRRNPAIEFMEGFGIGLDLLEHLVKFYRGLK